MIEKIKGHLNNKNVQGIIAIVVVVLFIISLFVFKKHETDDQTVVPVDQTVPTIEPVKTATHTTTIQPISYSDALKKYSALRIQLGSKDHCQAVPNSVTYKNGTTIMVDNRSAKDINITLGAKYTIKAYGFKIITLSSAKLPATWLLDCDNQQNVATILLQK